MRLPPRHAPATGFLKKNANSAKTLLRFSSYPPISRTTNTGGRLAQLVERLVYTEDVGSSSLSSPTIPFLGHCFPIINSSICLIGVFRF